MPDTIIRVSSLATYPDCNRRAATRLFRDDIISAGFRLRDLGHGIGAAIGNAVHWGARQMMLEKATSGSLPPATVATDAARDLLREQLRDGVEFDGPNGRSRNSREAEAQTTMMTLVYHRFSLINSIHAVHAEERFEAEIAPQTNDAKNPSKIIL